VSPSRRTLRTPTCASLLIAAGAHPKAICDRLGHASITITMDRYGHLLPSVDAALADALDVTHEEAASPRENVRERRVTEDQAAGSN
jgi:integrase